MNRSYYKSLADSGIAMPIATDLVLHEQPDPHAVKLNGTALGKVIERSSRRYNMPIAIPLMDLTIEKSAILSAMGIPENLSNSYHFETTPSHDQIQLAFETLVARPTVRMKVVSDAISYIAKHTDLFPVGMCIGPFSLMTKLISDPIPPVYMYGTGMTAADDPEIERMLACLELATRIIELYVAMQVKAGAKAVLMCEPAANKVYISPDQLHEDTDVFDLLVLAPDRRIRNVLAEGGADLILHDCGELSDSMVRKLCTLDPVILSLGSSRKLWEDAALVPKDIVLYGNLPSKHFYSDEQISRADVERISQELIEKMEHVGHPFILGSECDVLCVPGCEERLTGKVQAMVNARRPACACQG